MTTATREVSLASWELFKEQSQQHHGFTPDHVVAAAREQVARRRRPARV